MGNVSCAGLCGNPALDEKNKGEIRNSFIQKDLQMETDGKQDDDDYNYGKQLRLD